MNIEDIKKESYNEGYKDCCNDMIELEDTKVGKKILGEEVKATKLYKIAYACGYKDGFNDATGEFSK